MVEQTKEIDKRRGVKKKWYSNIMPI
jgi:hypothetical protein